MNHISRILQTAEQTINQRAADRDAKQERSMAATVQAFNAIHGTNLTEAQGWNFMVLLKIKRAFTGGYKEDDHVDMAAYVALCSEAMHAADDRPTSTVPTKRPPPPARYSDGSTHKEPPPQDWKGVKS